MKIYYVDSFTDQAFKGNPAAVVILTMPLTDRVLQNIASEIGFSETAFLLEERTEEFTLRWFSPTTEVGLCGHASLATAKIYFEYINAQASTVDFHTSYGKLACSQEADLISIDLPKDALKKHNISSDMQSFFSFPIKDEVYFSEKNKYLSIFISDSLPLEQLNITSDEIYKINEIVPSIRGLIISNFQAGKVKMRFFDPWEGIPEDPVTGSAGLVVSEYWFKKLKTDEIHIQQMSLRGGNMKIINKQSNVSIQGQAKIILEGNLMVGVNGK